MNNNELHEITVNNDSEDDFTNNHLHTHTTSQHNSIKGWDDESIGTLKGWIDLVRKTIFIYEYTLSVYDIRFKSISLCNIVVTAIISACVACVSSILGGYISSDFGGANVTLLNVSPDTQRQFESIISDESNTLASFILSIVVLVLSSVLFVINGVKELYGWDSQIRVISEHMKKAIDINGSLEIQDSLPLNQRKDAKEYILKYSEKMIAFRNSLPDIGISNYIEGEKKYEEYKAAPKNLKMMFGGGCTRKSVITKV